MSQHKSTIYHTNKKPHECEACYCIWVNHPQIIELRQFLPFGGVGVRWSKSIILEQNKIPAESLTELMPMYHCQIGIKIHH